MTGPGNYRNTPFWNAYDAVAQELDRRVGWSHLPKFVGIMVLEGLRNVLRKQNLQDTSWLSVSNATQPASSATAALSGRTADGSYNDLEQPAMGMAGTRFGRNIPLSAAYQESPADLLSPNPRAISRELLTRTTFQPASTLNLLAAAWIQFMVKDWFSHGEGDPGNVYELPLAEDDPWPRPPLTVLKTCPDPTRPPGSEGPQTYLNHETPWWDASQIYGGGIDLVDRLPRRSGTGGKLLIGADGRLPLPADPKVSPDHVPGWWLGLEMMFTLFVLEHNAVCDTLKRVYPSWSDEELYQRARLIIAALLAKIHTVEWTPAIIAHPTTVTAMHVNWWGLAGQKVRQTLGRISKSEIISGIPGSAANQFGVPYSLTEEFSIVYRMHPLIRDEYTFRSVTDGSELSQCTFRDIAGPAAHEITGRFALRDLFYSFGITNPGALVLNNYPHFLTEFQRPDNDTLMDLAATDILRTRELGVPRYNEFRRLLHLKPVQSFEELAGDKHTAAKLSRVYDGDIERVDTIVGMFAEKKPRGFGFSDTAFRVFILMASRRLNSDRFFTSDFNTRMYTRTGMDWVQNTTMTDVLLRHYPELRPALRGVTNAFAPWAAVHAR